MPDDESDDGDDRPARFPGVVKAAGWVWIVVGALQLINMVVSFEAAGAQRQQNQGRAGATSSGGCCAGLVGLAFVVCGFQTVKGTAKDTLGNGVGSIVLGGLQLLAAVVIAALLAGRQPQPNANAGGAGNPPPDPAAVVVIAGLVGLAGVVLITAGVMALVGRRDYLAWRRENAPEPRRRRRRPSSRRDDEVDEDDDRPRRRRYDDDEDDR